MKFPFQSIRWRIQAWHGVILLIAIAAFCAMAYQFAWQNQSRRVDREIQRNERQLIQTLTNLNRLDTAEYTPKTSKRFPFPEDLFNMLSKGQIKYLDRVSTNFTGKEAGHYYFAFANAEGDILLASENAPDHLDFLKVPEDETMREEFRDKGNFRESVHSFSFGLRSVIGHEISAELEEKHRFGWSLAMSGIALWLIGLLGGWWLAGKAIRPIQAISRTATRIAEGNLSERISTSSSDSELDQLSHVLNHTFDRLSFTLEQQRQFTADASHELRTPLTILLSESKRMSKREIARSTEDYQEAFDLCHDAAERMRRLVESLLLLARQDGDTAPQELVDCDLAEIIVDSVSLIEPLAASKRVDVQCDLSPCPLKASPELLAIVFNNLIGNAVQHHPGDGFVKIEIKQNETAWVVRIADDGLGISEDDLPRIFDRFYRVDRARSLSQEGHSGLGLALTKTIVQNMGGRIDVVSELDKGSEFMVTIPLLPQVSSVRMGLDA